MAAAKTIRMRGHARYATVYRMIAQRPCSVRDLMEAVGATKDGALRDFLWCLEAHGLAHISAQVRVAGEPGKPALHVVMWKAGRGANATGRHEARTPGGRHHPEQLAFVNLVRQMRTAMTPSQIAEASGMYVGTVRKVIAAFMCRDTAGRRQMRTDDPPKRCMYVADWWINDTGGPMPMYRLGFHENRDRPSSTELAAGKQARKNERRRERGRAKVMSSVFAMAADIARKEAAAQRSADALRQLARERTERARARRSAQPGA